MANLTRGLWLGLFFGAVCVSPGQAQRPCVERPSVFEEHTAPALESRCSRIALAELAHAWAPILWFADDEPLVAPDLPPIPSPMPGDGPPESAVVYYRLRAAAPAGGGGLGGWLLAQAGFPGEAPASRYDPRTDTLDLSAISLVRLQYLFYYPDDLGAGAHRHDIESVELWIKVDPPVRDARQEPIRHRLSLYQAVGYAHGHVAYANKLRVDSIQVTRLPLVVLVEMGKHATSPDRNADGRFTPGVDVTLMVSDAWGVRDSFGFNYLGQAEYSSWMTLSRSRGLKAHPAGDPLGPRGWNYELRDFTSSSARLFTQRRQPPPDFLPFLEAHNYRAAPAARSLPLIGWLDGNLSLRYDLGPGVGVGGAPGFQMPLVGGYPILAFGGGWRREGDDGRYGYLGAYYTPSVMGFASWYTGVTAYASDGYRREVGPEMGLKLRIPIERPTGPLYFGIRVGIRARQFTSLDGARAIVELGRAIF